MKPKTLKATLVVVAVMGIGVWFLSFTTSPKPSTNNNIITPPARVSKMGHPIQMQLEAQPLGESRWSIAVKWQVSQKLNCSLRITLTPSRGYQVDSNYFEVGTIEPGEHTVTTTLVGSSEEPQSTLHALAECGQHKTADAITLGVAPTNFQRMPTNLDDASYFEPHSHGSTRFFKTHASEASAKSSRFYPRTFRFKQ